jgi:hypothetical protein
MDAATSRAILLEIHCRFTPIQLKFHPPPHEHSLRHRFIELIDRFTKDFIWFSKISPKFRNLNSDQFLTSFIGFHGYRSYRWRAVFNPISVFQSLVPSKFGMQVDPEREAPTTAGTPVERMSLLTLCP